MFCVGDKRNIPNIRSRTPATNPTQFQRPKALNSLKKIPPETMANIIKLT